MQLFVYDTLYRPCQAGNRGFTAPFKSVDPRVIKQRIGDCVETNSMPRGFSHPLRKEEREEGAGKKLG